MAFQRVVHSSPSGAAESWVRGENWQPPIVRPTITDTCQTAYQYWADTISRATIRARVVKRVVELMKDQLLCCGVATHACELYIERPCQINSAVRKTRTGSDWDTALLVAVTCVCVCVCVCDVPSNLFKTGQRKNGWKVITCLTKQVNPFVWRRVSERNTEIRARWLSYWEKYLHTDVTAPAHTTQL